MTDDTPNEPPKRNPMAEEAAIWFARMRGPEAENHQTAFDAWLARGALHRRAYNRAVEIFSDGKFLRGEDEPSPRERDAAHTGLEEKPGRSWRNPLALVTIFTICVLMILGWAVLANPTGGFGRTDQGAVASQKDNRSSQTEYRTGTGEVRSETLADGSAVTLQPDSLLVVQFDPRHRDLRLERGRARFEVAHETRPFVVYAGGGTVTARGTIFDVKVDADRRVTVKLERGSVDVILPDAPNTEMPFERLSPGQAISFDGARMTPVTKALPTSSSPASAQSVETPAAREFERIRLSDLIEKANKGAQVRLRLEDPALGNRTLSGKFRIDDTAKLAERIAAIFELRVERIGASEILLSKPPPIKMKNL